MTHTGRGSLAETYRITKAMRDLVRWAPRLKGLFGDVQVVPLDWALKLNPRPWARLGAKVGDLFGCGARI